MKVFQVVEPFIYTRKQLFKKPDMTLTTHYTKMKKLLMPRKKKHHKVKDTYVSKNLIIQYPFAFITKNDNEIQFLDERGKIA